MADQIQVEDFERVEIRVGVIREVEDFPEARKPLYRLRIDFGPETGERRSAAGLPEGYPDKDALLGRQVLAVLNFPPRRIAKFMSECLVLGVPDEAGGLSLLSPDRPVPLGGRVY